jgi:Uma2 family endonuclease
MAATAIPGTSRESFVLDGVSWQLYERLVQELADQRIFITFDGGRLELTSPSPEHEWWKSLMGRLIEVLALERAVAAEAMGSTTFKRGDLAKGLEPGGIRLAIGLEKPADIIHDLTGSLEAISC